MPPPRPLAYRRLSENERHLKSNLREKTAELETAERRLTDTSEALQSHKQLRMKEMQESQVIFNSQRQTANQSQQAVPFLWVGGRPRNVARPLYRQQPALLVYLIKISVVSRNCAEKLAPTHHEYRLARAVPVFRYDITFTSGSQSVANLHRGPQKKSATYSPKFQASWDASTSRPTSQPLWSGSAKLYDPWYGGEEFDNESSCKIELT